MKSYGQKINYSSWNEDSSSEIRALRICGTDRVLCLTGSGARPLDLLTGGPAEIVSVDFNPGQNHLLELKMRAIAGLGHPEFLEFIGIKPSLRRVEIYRRLRPGLTREARHFWDSRSKMILKGVIYQGGWERYFKRLAVIVGIFRAGLLRELFSDGPVDRQRRLWTDAWDSWEWRLFLRLVSGRALWKYALRDPGFYRYVPKGFSIYHYLESRLDRAFKTLPVGRSAFATLLFFGQSNSVLPPHLQEQNYQALRRNLQKVRWVTASLGHFLDRFEENSIDKYSLSDFSSYSDEKEYRRIWHGVLRTAAPGARVCERQFLSKRPLPITVEPYVRRDQALERELEETDNSMFYSFITAEVRSAGNE